MGLGEDFLILMDNRVNFLSDGFRGKEFHIFQAIEDQFLMSVLIQEVLILRKLELCGLFLRDNFCFLDSDVKLLGFNVLEFRFWVWELSEELVGLILEGILFLGEGLEGMVQRFQLIGEFGFFLEEEGFLGDGIGIFLVSYFPCIEVVFEVLWIIGIED